LTARANKSVFVEPVSGKNSSLAANSALACSSIALRLNPPTDSTWIEWNKLRKLSIGDKEL
jgi:hypothetical protein